MLFTYSTLIFCLINGALGFDTLVPRNETQDQAVTNSTDLLLPTCGQLCFAQVLPAFGCDVGNTACVCPNANLTSSLYACSASNCTIPDQLAIQQFTQTTCGAQIRDRTATVRLVTWTLFALTLLFVGARFIARPERLKGSGYGSDDGTIVACMLVLIPLDVLTQTMTNVGLGTDIYTIPPKDITLMLMVFFVFEILYCLIIFLTKVSILQLYLRIWTEAAVTKWFRIFCWALIGLQLLTMFAFAFSLMGQCNPVSFAWTDWDGLHKGQCINREAQIYILGAFNVCYDVIVFILPLHNFLKLNISWRRKAGVCLIFMAGLLVTMCSIVRLQYLVKIGVSPNPTWDYRNAVIWSVVECNVSVICTCMPAMAGLIQRCWAALAGNPLSTSSSESKTPIRPTVPDPETPVTDDEMLQVRPAGSIAGHSVTELHETNEPVPTEKFGRDELLETPDGGIEIKHEPPSETTATKLSYRDAEGRLHEVKVIDKPTDDVVPPDPSFAQADERESQALRELREAETIQWNKEPSMERDWTDDRPGRRL